MNTVYYKISAVYCFIIILMITGLPVFCPGAEKKEQQSHMNNGVIIIKVKENQNIRDIAREHLDDPDLWEDVLRANGLTSPHEIQPGMTLRIPAGEIFQAKATLNVSSVLITKATQAGAKLFAPEKIARAVSLRNEALAKQKAGDWLACVRLAKSSEEEAQRALNISKAKQNVPAEAVISYCQGQVHSRKPSDNVWKDVYLYDILQEGDRVRTLSQSYADILFRDDSRLNLKENSQALIRRIRSNLLENTEEARVSLVQGDVLALLADSKNDERFEINIPGVDTKINSRRFWVGHDKEGSRFANYEGEIEISSGGENVVLKENQGSVVPRDQKPSAPRELLSAVQLIEPPDGSSLYLRTDTGSPVILIWKTVNGAEFYLLEIAKDGAFTNIIRSKAVRNTEIQQPVLKNDDNGIAAIFPPDLGFGTFYWRVIAFSPDKLPGRISDIRLIHIIKDNEPPFLVIRTPEQDAVLSEEIMEISGKTEADVSLTIQDSTVEVAKNGDFDFKYKLSEGKNVIHVKATDQAGNITELKRTVMFIPADTIALSFASSLYHISPDHFLVAQPGFPITGQTEPESTITITAQKSAHSEQPASGVQHSEEFSTLADKNGEFQINMKLTSRREAFVIEVMSRSGKIRTEQFTVEIDDEPPVITLDKEIPRTIGQKKIQITGTVSGGTRLDIQVFDSAEIEFSDRNRIFSDNPISSVPPISHPFEENIELKPGTNYIHFTARDPVGNIAKMVKEVFSDSDAPELADYSISLHKAIGGENIKITANATDATELMKAAQFTVKIGKYVYNGHMIRTEEKGKYTGNFHVPKNIKGEVKLTSITLSDYLGNRREVVIGH